MPHEQLSFKKLQDVGFLKNGFHIKRPLRLLDAEHPACVYLAVAGAELGRIFSMWPEMKKAGTPEYRSLSNYTFVLIVQFARKPCSIITAAQNRL